ncbi:MAG: hypothetical protein ACPGYY_09185 [Bacteroidia bacterium]
MKLMLPLFLALSGFAQTNKYLVLEHRHKQKEVVIAEGEVVIIKTFKGERISGRMTVLSEALIRVKHKVVPLTNVQYVGRRNQKILRIASLVVSTGANLLLYGISEDLRDGWGTLSENHKASVPMLAVGIPFLTMTYKRTSKNWKYKGELGTW